MAGVSSENSGWKRTFYGVGGLIALAALFLGIVMLANAGLRGMRLDLTENKLYTLTSGTQQVLAELKDPVNLVFYFSRETAGKQSPLILPYANRVREFLEEVAARSNAKVRLRVVDPQQFSDDEDRASEYGLQPLQGGGDALYFGLAGSNSTDGRSSIPNFSPDREEFLEYDVAKLIHELGTPKKPVVGLLSSLGMQGRFDPSTGQMGEPWPILAQIQQIFTVRPLTSDADHIDKDVDVLMVVHPKNLPTKTLYAIDQFVMRGGRMLLFVDPNSGADSSGQQDPQNPLASAMANHSSTLEPLLSIWGVAYDAGKVVGDLQRGLEVRTSMQAPPTRHIGILGLHHADMDQKDVVTSSLDVINVATAGILASRPGAKTVLEPLLSSSASAAPLPSERFAALSDPAALRDGFRPTGIRYALAVRLTGPVDSAFPKGMPEGQSPAAGPPLAHLAKSAVPANIVIIADTDLLMDYMWVQMRELFGQRVAQPFASNGDFIANVLDNLSGSSALISIRGRATFSRPFDRVEALRRQADDRLRSKALELQTELQQTETKLTELQGKRNDQTSLMLSPEQEQELKRFTAEKARVRKQLRETQRGLNVDIDRLESNLKILNIAVVPLVVALAGGFILALRRRRKSRGSLSPPFATAERDAP